MSSSTKIDRINNNNNIIGFYIQNNLQQTKLKTLKVIPKLDGTCK
jgi:hypothetical protein